MLRNGPIPNRLKYLHAIHHRHVKVQDDQVYFFGVNQLKSLLSV
jgi:hypothetical protein